MSDAADVPLDGRVQGLRVRELTAAAVEEALRLAPEVVGAATVPASERCIDIAFPDVGDAVFARKRINEALAVGEWLDEVEVWVWRAGKNVRPPLSDHGAASGFELRIERRT